MFPAKAYAIRTATAADDAALQRLAVLGHGAEISLPALIGEIDGRPVAGGARAPGRRRGGPGAGPPPPRAPQRHRPARPPARRPGGAESPPRCRRPPAPAGGAPLRPARRR